MTAILELKRVFNSLTAEREGKVELLRAIKLVLSSRKK
jgi:hypothetical protein